MIVFVFAFVRLCVRVPFVMFVFLCGRVCVVCVCVCVCVWVCVLCLCG